MLATRRIRLLAVFIDNFILIALLALPVHLGAFEEKSKLLDGIAISLFLCLVGIQLFLLIRYGQTIGKMITKIRIVDQEDLINGGFYSNVLKRGLIHMASFTIIVPIIDWLFIFGKSKKCIHDMIAGTIVIQSNPAIVNQDQALVVR
jgi:uncharacterized RDD family membrane protein YckC